MKVVETDEEKFFRYLSEVKSEMKNHSKNELIQIIGALLVDKHTMFQALQARKPLNKVTQTLKRIFHV